MLCVDVVIPQAVLVRCRLAGISDRARSVHYHKSKQKLQWCLTVYFFESKVTFEDAMYTNGSGTLSWARRREFSQPLHCSYFRRTHMLYCVAFAMEDLLGVFLFVQNGQCDHSRNN